jgi:hypothetical protein
MCTPLAIAGLALTAGSTVANTIAQGQVTRARNDALAAERIRQGQLDQEAEALNAQSRDRYDDFEGQQGEKASELGQYFTDQKIENSDANAAVTQEQTAPQSGSSLTVREEQKQRDKATAFTDQQGEALGNLRAFGDLLGGISRDQARDASQIGQIGGFKRGSSNVIPLELEAANQKGSGMRLFGDVLGLGGSLALNKGLGGSFVGSSPTVVAAAPTTFSAPVTPVTRGSLFNLYGAR